MSPQDQKAFFAGAVRHGNLAQAFWEVATDADAMKGDHEQYVKLAFERAIEASRIPDAEAVTRLVKAATGAFIQLECWANDCGKDVTILALTMDRLRAALAAFPKESQS